MARISVIIKKPRRAAERVEVENDLMTFQHLVDGYIKAVPVPEAPAGMDLVMIVNEEGELWGMRPNFKYHRDVIVGTAVFVGVDGEDFADCPDVRMKFIKVNYTEGEDLFIW